MSLTMTSKVSECQAETLQFMAIEKVSKKYNENFIIFYNCLFKFIQQIFYRI